jgi:PRC-barrel domain
MLRSATYLQGFTLRAMDGEIGKVDQFYLDDETWAIRYLVVNTGSWLAGRLVLISLFSVGQTDWESKQFEGYLQRRR